PHGGVVLAADYRHVLLLDVGGPAALGAGGLGADDGQHVVHLDELADVRLGLGRVALVILDDQLDLVALDAAGGVDRVDPGLQAGQVLRLGGRAGKVPDRADEQVRSGGDDGGAARRGAAA